MARIRTIKPGFFLNEELAELPFQWRLLFIGLWTQADRAGRLEDRPARLKAVLFPYDDLNVSDGLGCLAHAGFIVRYDRDGAQFIEITKWTKHQQPHVKEADSEIPGPEHGASTVLAPVEPVGREGKGTGREQEGEWRARFDLFWEKYPRKVGKDAAWAEWKRLKPDASLLELMLSAVLLQSQSRQWRENDGEFIPHPRTWLRQGRWHDEPGKTATGKARGQWTTWECPHEPECESRSKCADADILGKLRKAVTA